MKNSLGVFSHQKKNYLLSAYGKSGILYSTGNGTHFSKVKEGILIPKGLNYRFSSLNSHLFLTYLSVNKKQNQLYGALSPNLSDWGKPVKIGSLEHIGMVVPGYRYKNRYLLYYGGKTLGFISSSDLKNWEPGQIPVLKPDKNLEIEIGGLLAEKEGVMVVYLLKGELDGKPYFSLRSIFLNRRAPEKIIWDKTKVLWDAPDDLIRQDLKFLGILKIKERLVSYWQAKEEVFSLTHFPGLTREKGTLIQPLTLERIGENPLLEPRTDHFWESKAVFNSTAIREGGKVHLIYRAIGERDTSVLGYATSSEGTKIDERLPEPIYVPTQPFECGSLSAAFCSIGYLSGGGGYGGCEDPRIVKIEDRLYMTYVAFDGCNPPRVALTSIKVEDFLARRWRWKTPVLISPPGVVDKNACLLPEKVKGKYVIFHRIYPDILIDFVDDLDFDGKTRWLKGEFRICPRPSFWDSRKIGAGAPPLKTEAGWLLIYQAVGNQDPGRYKMGAMLLDLGDPTRVIYRSSQPILTPDESYENKGHKSGVVYPCGAVTIKDELFVYYGGADTVVCAARVNLAQFLKQLKYDQIPKLEPIAIRPTYH